MTLPAARRRALEQREHRAGPWRAGRCLGRCGRFYEATGGDQWDVQDSGALARQVGISTDEVRSLIQYLEGQNLLKAHWTLGGQPPSVNIEHLGVAEVEEALAEPDEPTEHFAPINSINIYGDVHNSQVGMAGGDLNQPATFNGTQSDAVRAWLDKYRAVLPELDDGLRVSAEQQLDLVANELDKPEPSEVVVNGVLGSLRAFAQSAVASAGAGAMGLAEVIAHWPF